MSALETLIYGYRELVNALGVAMPRRSRVKVIGGSLSDSDADDATVLTIGADPLPTVATADATPVYVDLVTLAVGQSVELDAIVRVSNAAGTVRQSFKLSGLFYCAAGPTATLDGGSLTDAAARGTGAADARFNLSGAKVRLQLTGIVGSVTFTYDTSSV